MRHCGETNGINNGQTQFDNHNNYGVTGGTYIYI